MKFPLMIELANGTKWLVVVRALPSGRSLPNREPELRGVIEGNLAGWLRRRREKRR